MSTRCWRGGGCTLLYFFFSIALGLLFWVVVSFLVAYCFLDQLLLIFFPNRFFSPPIIVLKKSLVSRWLSNHFLSKNSKFFLFKISFGNFSFFTDFHVIFLLVIICGNAILIIGIGSLFNVGDVVLSVRYVGIGSQGFIITIFRGRSKCFIGDIFAII